MTTPTKNGLIVELLEYDCCVRTDAYMINGMLVLRTCADRDYLRSWKPQVTVRRAEHWFDENKDYGTMIVLPGDWEGTL